jgi:uncharacterized protein (TIRG00374 family)
LVKLVSETPGEIGAGGTPLGRRIFSLRNVVSFVLALVVLFLVSRQLLGLDWGEVWTGLRGANLGLFALALIIFYCSFPLRALRWKTLLGNVGYGQDDGHQLPSALGLTRIMYLAWFANCVTVARLGDAYRGYLLKKEAGVSFAVTLGTVLAERLLDLLVMAVMMGAGVLVVFGGSLPAEAARALAAGVVLAGMGVGGLLCLRRFGWAFEKVLPERLRAHYHRLEHGVVGSLRGRRSLALLTAYSVGGWVLEGTALYATAAAVGVPISVAGALVVALAASLLTTVPVTPAGLGFAEAGMLAMLQWLGLDAPTSTVITLLFRVINYWSIVVLGFALYAIGRNRRRLLTKAGSGTPGASKRIYRFFKGRS